MPNNSKENKSIKRNWHLFDAREESFGRMASKIAVLLRGKNKVSFVPHIDGGDFSCQPPKYWYDYKLSATALQNLRVVPSGNEIWTIVGENNSRRISSLSDRFSSKR